MPEEIVTESAETDTPFPVEDPTALYRKIEFSGEPKTAWDRITRFAHKHKRKVYATLLIAIVGSFAVTMRRNEPTSPIEIANNYFGRFTGADRSDWAYQISGASINEEYLGNLFRILNRVTFGNAGQMHVAESDAAYRDFVRDQFETDLIVGAALKNGQIDSTEARFVIENAVRHAIADYYVLSATQKPESDFRIVVTPEEAQSYYEKNKDTYAKNGLSKNDTLAIITRTLAGLKRQAIQTSFMQTRRQIIEHIKNEGGHRVNRTDLIEGKQ